MSDQETNVPPKDPNPLGSRFPPGTRASSPVATAPAPAPRAPSPGSESSMSNADETTKPAKIHDFTKKPDCYDGLKAKFKRFWNQVLAYLTINKSRNFEENVEILFVLSYMTTGAAERWAQNYRFKYFAEDNIPTNNSNYDSYDTADVSSASKTEGAQTKEEKWSDKRRDRIKKELGQDTPPDWATFVRALRKAFKDKSNNGRAIN